MTIVLFSGKGVYMTNTEIQAFVDEVTKTLQRFEDEGAKWEHVETLIKAILDIQEYLRNVPTPDGRVVALYAALQYSWRENSALRKKLEQADKNISTLIQSNAQLTDLVYKMDARLQWVEKNIVEGSTHDDTHDGLTDGSTQWSIPEKNSDTEHTKTVISVKPSVSHFSQSIN